MATVLDEPSIDTSETLPAGAEVEETHGYFRAVFAEQTDSSAYRHRHYSLQTEVSPGLSNAIEQFMISRLRDHNHSVQLILQNTMRQHHENVTVDGGSEAAIDAACDTVAAHYAATRSRAKKVLRE